MCDATYKDNRNVTMECLDHNKNDPDLNKNDPDLNKKDLDKINRGDLAMEPKSSNNPDKNPKTTDN
jgi:hypothetical protein